jgi:6,7-dimethyl-8-ribityllumazine synthase
MEGVLMARKKIRLGIVVSKFNSEITMPMLREAIAHAKREGAEVKAIVEVPGAYETPLAVQKLLLRADIDAAVALGTVIKGETKHDEAITYAVCKYLLKLQLKHGKPVGLGITGPGITWKQSKARMKEYADRAVEAAVWMCKL